MLSYATLFVLFGAAIASINNDCLECICGIESNGGNPGCGTVIGGGGCPSGCVFDVNSCSCGPYQIKEPYFRDCSEFASVPINDWVGCATNEACAETCVENYMDRYGTYCTGKPSNQITCEEYGGIHNGGPSGCDSSATDGYRDKVRACCNNIGQNCD